MEGKPGVVINHQKDMTECLVESLRNIQFTPSSVNGDSHSRTLALVRLGTPLPDAPLAPATQRLG